MALALDSCVATEPMAVSEENRLALGAPADSFRDEQPAHLPALQDAMNGRGTRIMGIMNFPAGGTNFQVIQNGVVIHYMCNVNGMCGDFKFK